MRSASVWLTLLLLSCVAVPSAVLAQESDLALLAEKLAKKLEKHRGKKLIVADFSGPKSETTHLGRELADELSAAVATQNPSIEVLPRSTSVVIFTDPAWGFPEEILLGRDAAALAVTSEAELVVTGELQVKRNQLELTIRLWEIPLNSKETLILLNSYPLVRHKAKLALTEARRSAWEKLLPSVEKGKRRISAGFRWPQSSGEEQAAAASADTTARQENPSQNPPEVFRPGKTGVTAPQCQFCPPPQFPPRSSRAKIQGTVTLQVIITPEGKAQNIRVARSFHKDFDASAVEAVKKWKFIPAKGPDGKPVHVEMLIEVTFRTVK